MKMGPNRFKLGFYVLIFLLGLDSSWGLVATMLRKPHRNIPITIDDVTVAEGGNLVFTVSSGTVASSPITFDWATSNGTAIAGTHYTAASGQGTITMGNSTTTITVTSLAIALGCEPDRTMTVTLSNAVNATIADATGIGTIQDNLPVLSIANDTETEGTDLDFVVTLSTTCSSDVTFKYSTVNGTAQGGSDYTPTSGTATILSGQTTTTISVPTTDDSLREVPEMVSLTVYDSNHISSVISSYGRGTINDNEVGTSIVKVAATNDYTCALSAAGVVKCWGHEEYGHLGQAGGHMGDAAGEAGDNLPYVDLGTGVIATKISRGKYYVCVLTTTNQVKCWGGGGILGLGDREARGDNLGEMGDNLPYLDFGTGLTVKDLAVSNDHACVILNNDRVKCWGEGRFSGVEINGWGVVQGDEPNEMGDNLPYVDLGTGLTARKISASGDTTCVIIEDAANTNDGKVKCWGDSGWVGAKLGIGEGNIRGDDPNEMGDNLPFVDLGTGLTATQIFVGLVGVCVILDDVANTNDGKVKCWGDNSYGALGIGDALVYGDSLADMGDNLPILSLGTNYQVIDIAIGGSNTCFVLSNGSLKCVGWDGYEALGFGSGCVTNSTNYCGDEIGEMGDNLIALPFGGNTVTNVAYSSSHGCAILGTGEVACWGRASDFGDMGANILTTNNQWGVPADLGTGVTAFMLAQGSSNDAGANSNTPECAIMMNGKVKCWGGNFSGRLGVAHSNSGDQAGEMGSQLPAVDLGTGRTALDIAVSSGTACALLDNYEVKCWGDGATAAAVQVISDQPNEMGDDLDPIDLGTGRTAVAIQSADGVTCAILDNYTLKCWGFGWVPGLGHEDGTTYGAGNLGDNLPITDVGTGRKVLSVTSSSSPCAILDNLKVKCWGDAWRGQIGNGDSSQNMGNNPNEMGDNLPYLDLGTGLVPVSLVSGYQFSCALFTNSRVKCWGWGWDGRIGNADAWENYGDQPNEMGDNLPYIDLGTGRTAKSIFAGPDAESACAVLDNNTMKCWGKNAYGQLGLGDTDNRGDDPGEMGDSLPAISLGTGLIPSQVSVSSTHTCALMTTGELKCWGRNKFGELGLGDYSSRGTAGGQMGNSLPAVDFGL